MRISELIALRLDDLDFDGGFIQVESGCVRNRIGPTKNKGKSKVDMGPQLAKVLRQWLRERNKDTSKRGWGKAPEWLFYNNHGSRIGYVGFCQHSFLEFLKKQSYEELRSINCGIPTQH